MTSAKGCPTVENGLRKKNPEHFKKHFWCLVMMVTHRKSDEIEQTTKSSHCKANLYLFISFSEEKIAYITHTFKNEIYTDSAEMRAH